MISVTKMKDATQEGNTPPSTNDAARGGHRSDFQQRHGRGLTLAS
jgi:hypothetical protein